MDSFVIDESKGTATIMSIEAVNYAFTKYRIKPLIEIIPKCIVCKIKNKYEVFHINDLCQNRKCYKLKISDDVLTMLKLEDI